MRRRSELYSEADVYAVEIQAAPPIVVIVDSELEFLQRVAHAEVDCDVSDLESATDRRREVESLGVEYRVADFDIDERRDRVLQQIGAHIREYGHIDGRAVVEIVEPDAETRVKIGVDLTSVRGQQSYAVDARSGAYAADPVQVDESAISYLGAAPSRILCATIRPMPFAVYILFGDLFHVGHGENEGVSIFGAYLQRFRRHLLDDDAVDYAAVLEIDRLLHVLGECADGQRQRRE